MNIMWTSGEKFVVIKEFEYDRVKFVPGMVFTVLFHGLSVACEFEENLQEKYGHGHDCMGTGKMDHCWYINKELLEKCVVLHKRIPDWKV